MLERCRGRPRPAGRRTTGCADSLARATQLPADLPAHARVPAAPRADDRLGASRSRRVGLVHIVNQIVQHRPIRVDERARAPRSARRRSSRTRAARQFSIATEAARRRRARVGGGLDEPARGGSRGGRRRDRAASTRKSTVPEPRSCPGRPRPGGCPGDLGRRYGVGVRRSQPDPHASADRAAVRLPDARSPTGCGRRPGASRRSQPACPTRSRSRSRSASRSCSRRRSTFAATAGGGRRLRFGVRDAGARRRRRARRRHRDGGIRSSAPPAHAQWRFSRPLGLNAIQLRLTCEPSVRRARLVEACVGAVRRRAQRAGRPSSSVRR